MSRYIDEHRGRFGVEPICRTLGVSASAYYHRATGARPARRIEDERLLQVIERTHEANYFAYGYRRTWKALQRAGEEVGRDRVKRLMRQAGIQGARRRGKPWRTTTPDPAELRPPDLVDRDFTAQRPNEYRNSDVRARALPIWLIHYNTTRNHSSLGNRPPISRVRKHPRHNT